MPSLGRPRDSPGRRLEERLRRARSAGERLLVVYLTVADPLTDGPPDLAPVLAAAGADVLELGIPTPGTRPRGAVIGASFQRARARDGSEAGVGAGASARVWSRLRRLRRDLPAVPLVLLIYPETVEDIGWSELLRESTRAGIDGMVLTEPGERDLERVRSAGVHAIPLIRSAATAGVARRLEYFASGLTYRTLGTRTGEPLDADSVKRVAALLATDATKPFLAGFGIRYSQEIRALVPHVAGVVIGSEFLRLITETPENERATRAVALIREWKSATVLGSVQRAGGPLVTQR